MAKPGPLKELSSVGALLRVERLVRLTEPRPDRLLELIEGGLLSFESGIDGGPIEVLTSERLGVGGSCAPRRVA